MKKKLFIIVLILLSFSTGAVSNELKVEVLNRYIYYGIELLDNDYPILSYNDNTYIAARDVAKMTNKKIHWDEFRNRVQFNSSKQQIIHSKETGETIGKAIVKEFYGDRITENTKYYTTYVMKSLCFDDSFSVCVVFDAEEGQETNEEYMIPNSDLIISVSSNDGHIAIKEILPDGSNYEFLLSDMYKYHPEFEQQ